MLDLAFWSLVIVLGIGLLGVALTAAGAAVSRRRRAERTPRWLLALTVAPIVAAVLLLVPAGTWLTGAVTGTDPIINPSVKYLPAKRLAHDIGIGSMTRVVASDTFGTGGFSEPDPTYEVVATGDAAREVELVRKRLTARHFTSVGEDVWANDDDGPLSSVEISVKDPGGEFTFDGTRKTIRLPHGGVAYVVTRRWE